MAIGRVITMGGTDISDADAAVGEVLTGKKFYAVSGAVKTGTMPDSTGNGIIDEVADEISITKGYHDGTGTVQISDIEQAKIITGNIKSGVTILGVAGDSDVVDTSDANAGAGDIVSGKSGYVAGSKVNGSMTDRGTVSTDITTKAQEVTIAAGKHSGLGVVKIDATEQAKVIPGNIKSGVTILGVAGDSNVVDTSSGDAVAVDILATKKAWVDGTEITGSMTNRGEVDTDITTKDQVVTIAAGYHNGSGTVQISAAEQAKIIPGNIKSGITLLGQAGSSNVVDTSSGDAVAADIASGKKAWVDGTEITGVATGGGSIVVREYTSGDAWTKPAGLLYLWVCCVGGAGSGGSGRRGAADTTRGAASGGSGGAVTYRILTAAQLSASHTITIGTGGTGGAAQTADNTDGNNGAAGGDTSFGTLVISKGGGAGQKGSTSVAGISSGGSPYMCTPRNSAIQGGSAGQGNVASVGGTGAGVNYTNQYTGGGGGGGCISNANVKSNSGGTNVSYDIANTMFSAISGVGEGVTPDNGADNFFLGLFGQHGSNVLSLTKGLGRGGIGGGCGDTMNAGAGSNGGNYGAGGGGGGGSSNGYNSGKGGDGSNGLCIVIEFY